MRPLTKTVIEKRLNVLNRVLGTNYILDYAECYGGYCLSNNKGSSHHTMRMTNREIYQFIQGMLFMYHETKDLIGAKRSTENRKG
jgi:hypothetical protein